MLITNGQLQNAKYLPSPNVSGALKDPRLLVMHYTASGGSGEADAKFFQSKSAKASAHFVIDRDGTITQCVHTTKRAWHAGVSVWRGVSNCNDFSIGLEFDNWGILTKRADGTYRSWTNVAIPPENVIHAKNQLGVDGYWEAYSEAQIKAGIALTAAILEAHPTIREIVGHEDIAPRRKTDPGPAFPMMRFVSIIDGRADSPIVRRKVVASALQLRGGPGTNYDKISSLTRDTEVQVLFDAGDWSRVRVGNLEGWVFDQYLR